MTEYDIYEIESTRVDHNYRQQKLSPQIIYNRYEWQP